MQRYEESKLSPLMTARFRGVLTPGWEPGSVPVASEDFALVRSGVSLRVRGKSDEYFSFQSVADQSQFSAKSGLMHPWRLNAKST